MSKSTPIKPTQEEPEDTLDKRPWVMDWLFEIGHNMAIINHCYEKIQYLNKDLENGLKEPQEIVDKISAYREIRDIAYKTYDNEMTYLFDTIPNAQKDCRCLLKHTSTLLVLAQETSDSLDNEISDQNLNYAFQMFAGVVSLAFNIEFKTCMRCLYDGVKNISDEAKGKKNEGSVHTL